MPRRVQPDSVVCGADDGTQQDTAPTATELYLDGADLTPPRMKRLPEGNKYPTGLLATGVTGHATLEFTVGLDGRVEPCTMVLLESTHRDVAAAATNTLLDSECAPGKAGGQTLRVRVPQRFHYRK